MAKDTTVTKWNMRWLNIKNLLPNRDGSHPTSTLATEEMDQNRRLLEACHSMFSSLADIKYERAKNVNYYFNRQFCELVPDPELDGQLITEEAYMKKRGMTPFSINVIRMSCKALLGVYTNEKMEPLVKARIREEQKLGEMMTLVMQKVYEQQGIQNTIMRGYEEFLLSAIPSFRVGYDWDENRQVEDVYVETCDLNRMFWDDNVGSSDKYFNNVTTIGYLHDFSKSEVLARYSQSIDDTERINQAYAECNERYPYTANQSRGDGERHRTVDFYTPQDPYRCRVIEVWNKEAVEIYKCHDTAEGRFYTMPATRESRDEIDAINNQRKAERAAAGGNPDEAPLVERKYHIDRVWVCRHLTPTGFLLRRTVNPYLHGSHPFVIGGYPLIDGMTRSVVSEMRNPQRLINRELIRSEYAEDCDTKGFKWVNKKILDRSRVTVDTFAKKYSQTNGVVALDINQGEEKIIMGPVDTGKNSRSNDSMRKIEFFMQVHDKTSGTPGAIRGEKAAAGTPSALYAQQTEQANNNSADGVTWFNGLVGQLDRKILLTILQYYDKRQYLEIVGNDYLEQIKRVLSSDKRDILCDVTLIKSPSNGIARAETEDMLRMLYPDIGAEIYLENTSTHGADKVLEQLKSAQENANEAAMQQQQAAAMGGGIVPPVQ